MRKNRLLLLFCITAMLFLSGCGNNSAAADRTASFVSQSSGQSDPAAGQETEDTDLAEDTVPGLSDESGSSNDSSDTSDPSSSDQSSVQASSAEENSISYIGDLASESGDADVDLTNLSSVVIYSVVFNMMQKPEDYMGKTIRIFGNYSTAYEEQSGKRYHACIIQDATQCCAQGIEFELTDDYVYPDDYPEVWDDIVVVGTFDIYKDGGSTYCTLRNARLE